MASQSQIKCTSPDMTPDAIEVHHVSVSTSCSSLRSWKAVSIGMLGLYTQGNRLRPGIEGFAASKSILISQVEARAHPILAL